MLIAWPIEVGSRELDARLVFAVEAARKGHVFLSGTKSAVTELVVEHPQSAVYIHKSLRKSRYRVFRD